MQGLARVLSGDLDGGDASLQDAARIAEEAGAPDDLALAVCERALLAMARSDWGQAEALAHQARTALHRAGIEESYATPLVCAVRARASLHRGDIPAARQELVSAQRLRALLTHALPHLAVQARIELARAHLTLGDLAGARTLARKIDDLLHRRPGLGTAVDEVEALRDQLSKQLGSIVPGASSLTGKTPSNADYPPIPVTPSDCRAARLLDRCPRPRIH